MSPRAPACVAYVTPVCVAYVTLACITYVTPACVTYITPVCIANAPQSVLPTHPSLRRQHAPVCVANAPRSASPISPQSVSPRPASPPRRLGLHATPWLHRHTLAPSSHLTSCIAPRLLRRTSSSCVATALSQQSNSSCILEDLQLQVPLSAGAVGARGCGRSIVAAMVVAGVAAVLSRPSVLRSSAVLSRESRPPVSWSWWPSLSQSSWPSLSHSSWPSLWQTSRPSLSQSSQP